MKTLLLISLILSMMVYIGLKFFSVSLVYGDSYRAKVLLSSIPAPVPDL